MTITKIVEREVAKLVKCNCYKRKRPNQEEHDEFCAALGTYADERAACLAVAKAAFREATLDYTVADLQRLRAFVEDK